MISTPEQTTGGGNLWDRFTAPTERYRRPFRYWRRGRPFYAGLSVVFAGVDIWYWPHSSVGKMLSMGLPGISSIFIAVFLLIFGVTVWFFPAYRVFSGIASVMLGLLSLVATNLGGFFIGFLCAMLGGAFAVAWTPRTDYTAETRRQRRNRAAAAEFSADGADETLVVPAQAEAPGGQAAAMTEFAGNSTVIEQAAHGDATASQNTEGGTGIERGTGEEGA